MHRRGSWNKMLRLWVSHFEALEVPEAPRGDQESHKKLSKRPQVTIPRPCRRFRASRRRTSHPRRGLVLGWFWVGPVRAGSPESPMNQRSPDILDRRAKRLDASTPRVGGFLLLLSSYLFIFIVIYCYFFLFPLISIYLFIYSQFLFLLSSSYCSLCLLISS